ncbi:MAG TPA: YicC family protein [Candidatus Acetothermia bacterium]|nr:YicC family protein [Candidatus Acetothermia bacterium]
MLLFRSLEERMISSMTGFGMGTAKGSGWSAEVTLRTLNNRFLSVRVRALHDRPQVQVQVEEAIKRAFKRGEVGVSVLLDRDAAAAEQEVFSLEMIERYLDGLRQVVEQFSLPEQPTLSDLIAVGALQQASGEEDDPAPIIDEALQEAIVATRAARAKEGEHLAGEIEGILKRILSLTAQVEERLPEVQHELRTRMQEKIASLAVDVDPARMEMEIALVVERYDVQEEIARLQGHISRARSLLTSSEPVGKELDFLSQEMLREVNTLGSKSRDLAINGLVIDMKLAVNAFKEQVQNVE